MSVPDPGSVVISAMLVLSFVLLLVAVVALARWKQIPLSFARPRLPVIVGWICVFALVAVLQELIGGSLGGGAAPQWEALTPARVLRALTIVFLAPLAEEVALRGTTFGNLLKKGMPPVAVICLTALIFSVIHLQYGPLGLFLIFIDGLVFGAARHQTGSLFVPILLHTLGNAYAVGERIL